MQDVRYGFGKTLMKTDLETAIIRTTEALQKVGFGILSRLDVHCILKSKLDADLRPYSILGACNPVLAQKALAKEAHIGLLMPCNVLVQQEGEDTIVSMHRSRFAG